MTKPRFHVDPGDVPLAVAARRMGMSEGAFKDKLPELAGRGFPIADPTTGNFDLGAIDAWRKARHPQIFGDSAPTGAKDASNVARNRLKMVGGGG